MTRNFKVRLGVSLLLLVIAGVFLFILDSVPFKVFFGMFALVALIELLSFFKKQTGLVGVILVLLEIGFLVGGAWFVAQENLAGIILLIFGVCGYDVFAYLFGKWLGGKVFGKARPFPYVSKNKTWEGTILGLATSLLLVFLLTSLVQGMAGMYGFYWCAPLALVGDLLESLLKRQFTIKDSNEIVIKSSVFAKIELLVGGSEGHGGYLDRIDSMAFTATVLLLIGLL